MTGRLSRFISPEMSRVGMRDARNFSLLGGRVRRRRRAIPVNTWHL